MESRSDDLQKRTVKKRGVRLATIGLLLGCFVSATLELAGALPGHSLEDWFLIVGLVLGVQGTIFLILHTGFDRLISWDRHYIYVPLFGVAILFSAFVYIDIPLRHLMLMLWLVSLLFTAGLASFYGIALLSAIMGTGYLLAIAMRVAQGSNLSFVFESIITLFFILMNLFAGIVFERLRHDRIERNELRGKLSELALTDALTGLPNRRQFEQRIANEFARSDRYGMHFSVVMLDLDHFKNYNDILGHPAGDKLLTQIANVMLSNLRSGDFAARYGGEEFVFILPNTHLWEGVRMIERLRSAIESHPFEGKEIQPGGCVTLSAGIAEYPATSSALKQVLLEADQALYLAKQHGRNRVIAAEVQTKMETSALS
jgi:diguanylate cyclase (GGDEF)-like protein